MVEKTKKLSAYYQTKPIHLEVNSMDKLRELETIEDRPVIVKFTDSITIKNMDEYESEIFYLTALFERMEKLEAKRPKKKVLNELDKIYHKIDEVITSTLGEVEVTTDYSESRRKYILDRLNALRTTFKERKNFKPIDLSGRKSDILIDGRGYYISGIKLSKDANAALFTGVNCDIDVRNLNLYNIDVKGIYNAASLICGVGEESSNPTVTLTDINITGKVTSNYRASELISNLNGTLVARGVRCNLMVNYQPKQVEILNNYKLKAAVSSYFDELNLNKSEGTNVYYRKPKKEQMAENE